MKFFDFFAGIGGFRLGMEQAGHECVGHCEIDKWANLSYNAMHRPKESEVYFNDIRTVDATDMPEADCYCFGFPCQAFSISGNRRGFEDARGTLFFEVMRLAKVRKPSILFAENVAGLLTHEGGATFGTIITTMAELGYSVEWQVLNSKHFGSPQNRPRVFIIGHLGRSHQNRIFPISRKTSGILKGYQTDTNGKGHKSIQDRFYLKDGIMSCLPRARADTICTTVIDGEPHILTARERLRLQGFPDDMIDLAYEVNTPIELARQAGNSVTVNVIYEIAKRLELDE